MNSSQQQQDVDYREGRVARTIEHQTAKLPSDLFLWLAGASIVGSLAIQVFGPKRMRMFGRPTRQGQLANFVGQWAPTLLLLGVYNKIVKTIGSDQFDRRP
jgi:hypothetical protein